MTLTSRASKWTCNLCYNSHFGGASFYCKSCDFDACERCYLSDGYPEGFVLPQPGYMSHQNVPHPDYPPESGYQPQPQMGYPPQQGYPSQPQSNYPPQSGYPYQAGPNYPPQSQSGFLSQNLSNYSEQSDSETIKRLNETIKTYEIKIKNLETENINLRLSNMDERSKLQGTIDSLQAQLATKEGIIKTLETEKHSFINKNQQYEGDLNRLRVDLNNIRKEKECIEREKNEEIKNLGIKVDDLTKKSSYFESQFKIKENELGQINGRMIEEKKQMKVQIDLLNNQLIASQKELKNIEQFKITIKNYEEFLNKLKFDITQFQKSCPPFIISPVHP